MSDVHSFRWSYLLATSLVVAAASVVFLLLIHRERTQIVSHLTHRAAHASVDEAVIAVRQLGRLPRPPIEALVSAASAPSRRVAHEAQVTIGELLRNCQRQLNAGRKVARVASQLETLAASLYERSDKFSQRDYAWLAHTAERIVELGNQMPAEDDAQIAVHCDALLSNIPPHFHSRGGHATKSPTRPARNPVVTPVSTDTAGSPPTSDSVFTSPSRIAIESLLDVEANDADSKHADHVPWIPRWMPPGRLQPRSQESDSQNRPPLRRASDGTRPPFAAHFNCYESVDTRELLEQWLTAKDRKKLALEREMEKRGFRTLAVALVRPILHGDTNTRVRMVYDLTRLPGPDAKAWLMLLAEDSTVEVRLAAVTVMTTSNDHELRQKAWNVALHDRDPRIASFAERLRQ